MSFDQIDFNENPVISPNLDLDFGLRPRVCQKLKCRSVHMSKTFRTQYLTPAVQVFFTCSQYCLKFLHAGVLADMYFAAVQNFSACFQHHFIICFFSLSADIGVKCIYDSKYYVKYKTYDSKGNWHFLFKLD